MAEPTRSEGPGLIDIDLREYGGKDASGERQAMDARLFMQLLVLDVVHPSARGALLTALQASSIPSVAYQDALNPNGMAVLTWHQNPLHFTDTVAPLFHGEAMNGLRVRDGWSMLGRTYSSGHEPKLAWWLLEKPIDNVLRADCDWHVWYPLRRKGSFAQLPDSDVGGILREHAQIGFSYGTKDYAHDVRLACHGLDGADNEFVIGLVGKELHPLSHLVQRMRRTRQTSEFIEKMGPFFVGRVVQRVGSAPSPT